MRYLVISIRNGEVWWISKCRTLKGTEASIRHTKSLFCDSPKLTFKVLSVEDILAWESTGISELEAMYSL